MKGNNTLQLNESTMIAALQIWADSEFKNPPKVISVTETAKGAYSKTFEVVCSDPEPKESSS